MASQAAPKGMSLPQPPGKDMATLMAEIEIEMMSDMYNKITATCHKKCISSKYREPDLSKGESICLDRCVAKWTEIHEKIGHKLVAATTEQNLQQNPT